MEKLKIKGPEAKAGSNFKIQYEPKDIQAFQELKKALSQDLYLYQVKPNQPFQMRTDAAMAIYHQVEMDCQIDQRFCITYCFAQILTCI